MRRWETRHKVGPCRVLASVPVGGSVRDGATGSGTQRDAEREVPLAGTGLWGVKLPGRFPFCSCTERGISACLRRCCSGSDTCERVLHVCACGHACASRPPRGLAHPSVGACFSELSEQTRWAAPAYLFLLLCLPFFGFDSFRCPGGALACCWLLGGGVAATALLLCEGREGRGLECWLLCSAGVGGRRGGGGR